MTTAKKADPVAGESGKPAGSDQADVAELELARRLAEWGRGTACGGPTGWATPAAGRGRA
jgi:hypothetical protein